MTNAGGVGFGCLGPHNSAPRLTTPALKCGCMLLVSFCFVLALAYFGLGLPNWPRNLPMGGNIFSDVKTNRF